MDMGELLKMGATMFMNSDKSGQAGSNLDTGSLVAALSSLTGGGGGNAGLDLGALVSKMDAGGLGAIAQSWLGDGSNEAVSPNQVVSMLGSGKIADFASQLGLSQEEAAGGLADALPHMVDKASSGGSLLDSIGGVSGAIGLAGKLFGR